MTDQTPNELKIIRLYKKAFSRYMEKEIFYPRNYFTAEETNEWDELMEDR